MANRNIISDLANGLKIQPQLLQFLVKKENIFIGSALHDAALKKENTVTLNIGIGDLIINIVDYKCKFFPSKALKEAIQQSLIEKKDPLIDDAEQVLITKLNEICKREF